MTSRAAAARYARALLDVVLDEKGDPEQAERELTQFADLIAGNRELRSVLVNPAVPVAGKRGVMKELTGRAPLMPPVGKLLMLLADRDRLALLPDMLAVYRDRLMDHLKVVRAEVTTAMPLGDAHAALLQQKLADVTGRRVTMTTNVDPGIIGGVVAKIGGTVYDGSVATHLATVKQKLLQQR